MRENAPSEGFVRRALSWLLPFLVVSAAYLYTFPQPNIFYAGVVLLHALAGVVTAHSAHSRAASLAARWKLSRPRGMAARRGRRRSRNHSHQDRHAPHRVEVALPPHRDLARWRRPFDCRQVGTAGMVGFKRRRGCSARSNLPGCPCGDRLRCAIHPRKLADAQPHSKSQPCRPTT